MIIRRLQSENILRYKKLDLNNLPESGRILITGSNESGKSAIVETLSLAIFGRTSNLPHDVINKAIKWGADNASVSVEFLGNDNQEYALFRYFDADGVQRAHLNLKGHETPIAQGVEAVNQAAIEVIGFDFQQFTSSFYLTHGRHAHARPGETVKELAGVTALENLSTALSAEINEKEAAITTRINQTHELNEQITTLNLQEATLGILENRLDHTNKQVSKSATAIERWEGFDAALVQSTKEIETATIRLGNTTLDIGLAGWQNRCDQLDTSVKNLESICLGGYVEMTASPADALRKWLTQLQSRLDGLHAILTTVDNEHNRLLCWLGLLANQDPTTPTFASEEKSIQETIRQLTRKRSRKGWAVNFFLLLALILGGGFWLLSPPQQHLLAFVPKLTELLTTHLPFWKAAYVTFLLPAAGIFTLLTLINLIGRWRMKRKIVENQATQTALTTRATQAKSTVDAINQAANQPLEAQVALLKEMDATPWQESLILWTQEEGLPFLDAAALYNYLAGLEKRLKAFQTEIAHCRQEAREQLLNAQKEHATHLATVATLTQEIDHEKARREENRQLHEQIKTLDTENQFDTHAIATRHVAKELIKGTCVGLSFHFNQELHRFISRTAPLFTQGRYRHLRIDDDLNVSVFSVAKNDFVQVEEISTGVRRQLTLAVRMALAQALATRTGGTHLIALDEPFAYFDRQRCLESLNALVCISDKITQIWVIGQEFDIESIASDLYLQCAEEQDVLVMKSR